jgi:diacylglycerol kinase family enzyme
MHVHIVVNPVAGRRRAAGLADEVGARLERAGARVTRFVTGGAGDARAHAATLDPTIDRVLLAGGDGTLREVVNARALPLPWPLLLAPVGTANLVSRDVERMLVRDPERIAATLLEGESWQVDAMEILRGGVPAERAIATIGVGLDAEIVRAATAARKRMGTGGYRRWVVPVWSAFMGFRFPKITVRTEEGRVEPCHAVVLQKARTYGGIFRLVQGSALDSEHIDVVVVRTARRRDLLRLVVDALRGTFHLGRDITCLRTRSVTIESESPVPVQADGDPAGETPITVRVVPRALSLLRSR